MSSNSKPRRKKLRRQQVLLGKSRLRSPNQMDDPRLPADGADPADDSTVQINPAAVAAFSSAHIEVPVSSTPTANETVRSDTTKPTDNDSKESTGSAANQPASLSGNHFADALREPAANVSGQLSTGGANSKSVTVNQVRRRESGRSSPIRPAHRQGISRSRRSRGPNSHPPKSAGVGIIEIRSCAPQWCDDREARSGNAFRQTLLLDNLPAIRQRLADQNIKIDRFDVDLRHEGRGDGSPNAHPIFQARARTCRGRPILVAWVRRHAVESSL